MSELGVVDKQTVVAVLQEQLRERIDRFERLETSGRELKLVKEVHRRFCQIYMFSLSAESECPDLVVKVPVGHADRAYQEQSSQRSFVDRPRLFDRVDAESKSWKEYAALCRIQNHLDQHPDPRFGVVRVYDLLPQQQAMVMQWIDLPALRQKLYATHRFSSVSRAQRLEPAFSHTGAWLRNHHQLPPLSHCQTRNTTRDDYLAAVERFVAFLADHAGDREGILRMHERIVQWAQSEMPAEIPTGQVHGDFAPRNVFVDDQNCVSVFDTLGRFEAPIYEDIAKMLMTVNASGPQMLSAGMLYPRPRLERFQRAFLEGYFGDQAIPTSVIQLFLVQLLLEHWAAVVYRHREQHGWKRMAKGIRRSLWESGFRSYIDQLLPPRSRRGISSGEGREI
ncbi:phosphotransferase [Roseimaritima ulvae]|uniref:Phosphotransferase enzyme family protein n=1 Tax=Roseimaritima ulvae TaxID=980254 RepID=A0A5B9QS23_9BACT|nr:phosphotransferase [Roseimaritima ulvae]QEG41897.1 Phosphotransferase enzyme family protein [Roseimaritima ulvae]